MAVFLIFLEKGRTFHSRFKAPRQATEGCTLGVRAQTALAQLLKRGCQPAQAWEALKRGKHDASAERIDPADATTDAVDAAGKPPFTKMARLQSTVSAAVARAMAVRD